MKSSIGLAAATFGCVAVIGVAVYWATSGREAKLGVPASIVEPNLRNQVATKSRTPIIEPSLFEDGGIGIAMRFTGAIRDPNSLRELRDSIEGRGRLALEVLKADLNAIKLDEKSTQSDAVRVVNLHKDIALVQMYEGKFADAAASLDKALEVGQKAGIPPSFRDDLTAIRGIVALRLGEVSNCIACVGPSSCIFPIAGEATHTQKEGSLAAIEHFSAYLKSNPGDLRVRWLLNLAHMTLGGYPENVPPEFLIPIDGFASKLDVGAFENVAVDAKLTTRGPNLAGGSVFDDFTGDGKPDLFSTSLDADKGASFFVNKGDGTFEDRSTAAGLDDQVYALNVVRADYDNDGNPDILLLRGGWESPMRLSLLRNKGNGVFEDVTLAAGLGVPIATESAAWGDYDNDGLVDLFVCGEYLSPTLGSTATPDPRNRCRLYHNEGNGKFVDVAVSAGVDVAQCAKGSAWGDYDGDGRLDLFVSIMNRSSRLYHNEGDGTFRDVAGDLGVTGGDRSFACWFWDFDNDGKLDLYVNDYAVSLAETAAQAMKLPNPNPSRARLYRNLGKEGFRDVAADMGLEQANAPMGCNFGDIDNDGFLDVYLGTGGMSFEYLVPNLMFKNIDGKHFEDVTMSSRTGHLQKGHGISFADYDDDGDLDLFVEAGGAVPGDDAYNILFQNPGHKRHWLKVKLVGTKTNRSALGARLKATIAGPSGITRTIHRTVGNNGSFGGNSLVELFGLGDADSVKELEITWPTSKTTQTFKDVKGDRTIEVTEGADVIR